MIQTWILNTIYATLLVVGSPWLLWRLIKGKSRRGWGQKLLGLISPPSIESSESALAPETIWIHAVSVGEINLLVSIIQEYRKRDPEINFAISASTETGYDLAKAKYPECFVFFCPLDFTWAIRRVLKQLKPAALILTELELWPNLIAVADRFSVPVVVANGRLGDNSARGYERLSWVLRSSFEKLSLALCQSKTYADRFVKFGCRPEVVRVTGNVKFDGVQTDRQNAATRELVRLSGIEESEAVFLAGSTQLEEDLIAAKVFQSLASQYPDLRLVLAPRHPQRVSDLVGRLGQLGIKTELRSVLGSHESNSLGSAGNDAADSQLKPVLIIDVIGELRAWWGRADIAYVGGSMGSREGQNMIEPAAYGIPVSFGPRTKNFEDLVTELLTNQAATVVRDESELSDFVRSCLDDPATAKSVGKRAQQVVLNHAGASAKTVDEILALIRGVKARPAKLNISDAA